MVLFLRCQHGASSTRWTAFVPFLKAQHTQHHNSPPFHYIRQGHFGHTEHIISEAGFVAVVRSYLRDVHRAWVKQATELALSHGSPWVLGHRRNSISPFSAWGLLPCSLTEVRLLANVTGTHGAFRPSLRCNHKRRLASLLRLHGRIIPCACRHVLITPRDWNHSAPHFATRSVERVHKAIHVHTVCAKHTEVFMSCR